MGPGRQQQIGKITIPIDWCLRGVDGVRPLYVYSGTQYGTCARFCGDDFVKVGTENHVLWFRGQMEKVYESKHGPLDPGGKDEKELTVLNRKIRWENAGISLEADTKHVSEAVKHEREVST